MEKSRAIELLKLAVPIKALTQQEYADFVEAVNMGMDALKQPEKAQLSREGTTKDAISRQWLLDCINEGWIKFDTDKDANRFIHLVRDIAPPAQPDPHEGHWIKHETPDGGEQYECSRCGVLWEFNDGTPEDNEAYFCPKCGTKMKGVRRETD